MPIETYEVRDLFKKYFGEVPAHIVHAPGRLELLGNHTDYNDGLVMSLAVDKYIQMAVSPRTDGKIELVSAAFPHREIFSVDVLKKNPAAPWADYVKGVLEQLRKRRVHYSGFRAAICGNIPMGAGMSSSAALEVATALAVRRLHPYSLNETGTAPPPITDERGHLPPLAGDEKLSFARVCQAAENQFVGVRSGLLDQISSLFGKAWHVMNIDFQSLRVEQTQMTGEAIVICNSGVKHALVGGEYNELRQNCESAAAKLGVKSLRRAELSQVKASREKLTAREYECAYHVVSEIARVVAAERALSADDHRQFGQYMFQSHESSRDFFKNSTRELDWLVALARKHPATFGARLTGGGFGGGTINLIQRDGIDDFTKHMAAAYEKKSGHQMTPLLCQIVDGAA